MEQGGNSTRTAEISQTVRVQLKRIREDVDELNLMQKKEAKKARVSSLLINSILHILILIFFFCFFFSVLKKLTGDIRDAVNTRAEIVELCYKHIEECENWEKRRNEKRMEERSSLFMGGSGTFILFYYILFFYSLLNIFS